MDSIDLGPAAQQLAHLVSNVTDGQHSAPTPCPQYQVADLVEHIGTMARAFAGAARTFLDLFASPDAPAGDDVAFGPTSPVPDNASAFDQVLSLAGRDLSWSAA